MNTQVHIALSANGNKEKIMPYKKVMFLAGPIRNAPKWHEEAIRYAIKADTDTFVAVPVRSVPDDIKPHLVIAGWVEYFERQRAWEQFYLYMAELSGCTVFWLPKEADVKEFQDKIYAHITMMELGTALAKKYNNPKMKLVIGTDGEFPEWRTILLDIEAIDGISVCYTLEDTINTALKLIHG